MEAVQRWDPCFELGAATHQGRTHARNEDAVALRHGHRAGVPYAVLVVCDGVTSSSRGDLAAAIAADAAANAVVAHLDDATEAVPDLDADRRQHLLRTAVHLAHEAVCAATIEQLEDRDPPGTTLVAALAHQGRVDVAWVGDSRAYLLSPARVDQPGEMCVLLTHDHSWVNLVVDRGEMSGAEAAGAPLAHAITRCIGPLHDPDPARPAEVSQSHSVVTPDSRLVLCSDGVWGYAESPAEFCRLVGDTPAGDSAAEVAARLVAAALERGGEDDMTAAVTFVGREA